jgi:hypothetical protein
MNLYLKSCELNPTINWIIFTDQKFPENIPKNVRFEKLNLKGFSRLASEKLNLKIKVHRPYKLCDFRPAYGLVFSDYIKGYDFWGYTDLDIIYGNMRNFLTNEKLNSFEIVSSKEYLAGPFTIYRNLRKINELFKKNNNYKKVFLSEENYMFDENGINFINDRNTTSMNSFIKKNYKDLKLKILFKKISIEDTDKGWFLEWENGILKNIFTKKEIGYFHFIYQKNNRFFLSNWIDIPNKFYISRYGFSENKKFKLSKKINVSLGLMILASFFFIDKNIGRCGILIKKISPSAYNKLKNLNVKK